MSTQTNVEANMTKFLGTQKKASNIDDLRLGAIIKQGKDGQIVIVGCPFDYARKRSIKKGGQQNGPCCLRRFFQKVGPLYNSQYQIEISGTSISDYGNIRATVQQIVSPQKVILKIENQILALLKSDKFPFVFGGSKQCSLGSARAFHNKFSNGKHLLIAGMPFLKRPFDNDKLTSQNLLTILNIQFPQKQILFGPHQKYFPCQYVKNFKYISFSQVYEYNQGQNQPWQLGHSQQPVKKLTSIIQKGTPYHITLSVQAIERFSGCRDLPLHGIKPEQMTQIFFWLGQQQNVKSIDITQFNPSCQDYESSLVLLNLLYHFVMGWTKRQSNPTK